MPCLGPDEGAMRDHMHTCDRDLADDALYKDVVVIGNGPSGLVTSFLLAGHVPRLRAVPPDAPIDDMLRARLSLLPPGQDLLEVDLGALAEGLEGRSHNPVPLLMDNLLHPGADLGLFGESLVEWTHDERRRVGHVVLGRLPPGGAWHAFPAHVRSLSPAAWLALPTPTPPAVPGEDPAARVPAPLYASYCRRYVHMCKLQRHFRSGVVVTSVRSERRRGHRFRVTGYVVSSGAAVQYVCRRVVLAGGGGERPVAPLPALAAHALPPHADVSVGSGPLLVVGSGVSAADAVLAARGAAGGGRRVYHVHRRAAPALAALDPGVYPDYHEVYKMMCAGSSGRYHNYTSLPEHEVLQVSGAAGRLRVTLLEPATGTRRELAVADVALCAGARPDLSYLQTNVAALPPPPPDQTASPWQQLKAALGHTVQACKARYIRSGDDCGDPNGNDDSVCSSGGCGRARLADGVGFGVDRARAVARDNPLALWGHSHALRHAPPGVFAVGALAGDAFVRFAPGGALAAVAHIRRQMQAEAHARA